MADIRKQVDDAFEYRGHTTLRLKNNETLLGFVYNRRFPEQGDAFIEIFLKDSNDRRRLLISELESIELTGKDYAESYEQFLKRTGPKKSG